MRIAQLIKKFATFSLLAALWVPVFGEERTSLRTSAISDDGNGLPVIEVVLHNLKIPNRARTFRFLLDTGAGETILDPTVPSEFFWEEPHYKVEVKDATNGVSDGNTVIIKRVEVGGMFRDGLVAVVTSLKSSMLGRLQDNPVDGILGMNFLRGTRFILDPRRRRIEWWGNASFKGVSSRIGYGSDGRPYVAINVTDSPEVMCLLDTGNNGGFTLPKKLKPAGDGHKMTGGSLAGKIVRSTEMSLETITFGDGSWKDIQADFREGDGTGTIGQDVLGAGITCFDFSRGWLTLEAGEGGNLMSGRSIGALPVLWDRTVNPAKLVLVVVKPGSEWENGGAQAGDEILEMDGIGIEQLTRALIKGKLEDGANHDFWVMRQGGRIKLRIKGLPKVKR